MALVRNEFGIRGRVGNIVFCKLNGKSYMRSVPERIDSNTPKQQEIRSRFRVAVRFYQKIKDTPLKSILDLSADSISSSGYALFMRKNLKVFRANGKIGDFSQLHFSVGKRQQAYNLLGRMDDQGMVTLSWENNEKIYDFEATDRLKVVVLHSNRSFSPKLLEGVEVLREAGKAIFPLECDKEVKVHLYCFFESPDGKRFSNSQYIKL